MWNRRKEIQRKTASCSVCSSANNRRRASTSSISTVSEDDQDHKPSRRHTESSLQTSLTNSLFLLYVFLPLLLPLQRFGSLPRTHEASLLFVSIPLRLSRNPLTVQKQKASCLCTPQDLILMPQRTLLLLDHLFPIMILFFLPIISYPSYL
ncbi:hypothetical protein BJ912DRAFT_45150 [Pholiota molesta]|nr:hypothetical protein BJ912DRAFT_45150 [Pholiota molesta]